MQLHALTLANRAVRPAHVAHCIELHLTATSMLLDWLYRLFQPFAYGVWEDERLVAQYTALKRPLAYQGDLLSVGMSVNMAVHPDYRGRGYIKKMSAPVYDALKAEGVCFGLG